MNNRPLISAIIPTYNRADLVGDAIDSILAQTYPNVEIIVVDDGSTDNTKERLARYGDRIRIIYQRNAGPSAARNRGIAASHGEFISFLDSDDLWLPVKLERQIDLLEQAGESIPCCLSNIMMRWSDRDIASFTISSLHPPLSEGIWTNPAEILATRFVLFNQGAVIRRSALAAIGTFDESLRLLEDYEFALRLSLAGPWTFIAEPLVIWRETAGSCYQNSKEDDIRPLRLMVQILQRQQRNLNGRSQFLNLQRSIENELERTLGELKAAERTNSNFWFQTTTGKVLQRIARYRRAIFRRSPGFPTMQVTSIDAFRSSQPKRADSTSDFDSSQELVSAKN